MARNRNGAYPILELRVALTTADYDRLVKFYRLGIELAQIWENGQGKALMLEGIVSQTGDGLPAP